MSNINLVSGKDLGNDKQEKTISYLKITAIIFLILVALISAIFFILTLLSPISKLKQDQKDTLQGISSIHGKLFSYSQLVDRLKNTKGIIAKRYDYPKFMHEIIDKLPQDLTVTQMKEDNGVINFTVSGASLMSVNQYIDDIVLISGKSKFIKNLIAQKLEYSSGFSDYELTLQANLLK